MRRVLILTAVLLLIALNIEAQYSLMKKGERNPFDTAVAIEIKTYRIESIKMEQADSLITKMVSLLHSKELVLEKHVSIINNLKGIIKNKDEEILSKNLTILQLRDQSNYKFEKQSWLKRNNKYLYFASGVIVSGAIFHFVKK